MTPADLECCVNLSWQNQELVSFFHKKAVLSYLWLLTIQDATLTDLAANGIVRPGMSK
jgi:hypothetical protein